MAFPTRIDETPPVEIRPGGDRRTVRVTNPAGYDPQRTANGETPGKPNGDRPIVSPGNASRSL